MRVPGLAPLLSICAWLGVLAAISGLSVIDTGASVHRTSFQQWQSPYVVAVQEKLAVDEYHRASEIYAARYGEAPEAIDDLVQAGILDRATVSLAAKILDISAR